MFHVLRASSTRSTAAAVDEPMPEQSLIDAVVHRLKNDVTAQQLLCNTVLINYAPCPGVYDLFLRLIRFQLAASANNNDGSVTSGKKRRPDTTMNSTRLRINNYKPKRSVGAIVAGFSPVPTTQLGYEGARSAGVEAMINNPNLLKGLGGNSGGAGGGGGKLSQQVHIKVNKIESRPDGTLDYKTPSKGFNPDTDKRSVEFYDGRMFEIIEKNALVRDVGYQDRMSRIVREKPVNVVLVAADKRISSHWLRTQEFVAVVCRFIQKLHQNSQKQQQHPKGGDDASSISSTQGASSLVSVNDIQTWQQVPTFLLRALAYIGAATVVFPRLTTTSTRMERILFGQPARFYEIVNPFRLRIFTEELELYRAGGGIRGKEISMAWTRSMAAIENQGHLHGSGSSSDRRKQNQRRRRHRRRQQQQRPGSSTSSGSSNLRSSSEDVSSMSHTWQDQVMPAVDYRHDDNGDDEDGSFAFDALCLSAAVYTAIGTHYARDAQHTRVLYSHFYRQWRTLCTYETLNEIKSRDNSEYSRQMEKRLLNIGRMLFRDMSEDVETESDGSSNNGDLAEFDDMIDGDETRREFFRRVRMYKNVFRHIHPTLQIYHHQASRTPTIQQVHELDGEILYNLLILYERSGELWKLYDATGAPDIFELIEKQKRKDAREDGGDNDNDESSSSSSSSSDVFDWYDWDAKWTVIAFMEKPSSLAILTTIEDLSRRRRVEWKHLFQPGTWFVINPMEVITAFANLTGNSNADDYLRQFHRRCESRLHVLNDSSQHAGRITLDQLIQSPILICLREDWEYVQTVCTPVLSANPRTNRHDAAPLHPMLLAKFYQGSSVNLQAFILSVASFIDRHRSYSEKQQNNDPQKHVPLFDPTRSVPHVMSESRERNYFERQFALHVDKTLWTPVLEALFRSFLPVIMNRCEDEHLMKDLLWRSFRGNNTSNTSASGRLRYYSSERGENLLSGLRAFLSLQERHYISLGALNMLVHKFQGQGRKSIAMQLALPHHFQLILFLQDATENFENVKHQRDNGSRIPVPAAYPVVGGREFYYMDEYDDYDILQHAIWKDKQLPRYDFPLWMLLYHLCCIDTIQAKVEDLDRHCSPDPTVSIRAATIDDVDLNTPVSPPPPSVQDDDDNGASAWETHLAMSNADAIALFVGLSLFRVEVNVPGSALYNSPLRENVQNQPLPVELCYVKRVIIEEGRLAEAESVDWSLFYLDDERRDLFEKFHIDKKPRPSHVTLKSGGEKSDQPRVTLGNVMKYELHKRAAVQYDAFFGEKSGRSFPMARVLSANSIGPQSSDRFMLRSDDERREETYPGLYAMETMLRLLEEMHNYPQMLAHYQDSETRDFIEWGSRWKFTREEIMQMVRRDRDYPLRIFPRDGKALYSRDLFPVMSSDVLMSNDTAHKDATRELSTHEKPYSEVRPFDGSELGFIETLYLMPLDYLLDDDDDEDDEE